MPNMAKLHQRTKERDEAIVERFVHLVKAGKTFKLAIEELEESLSPFVSRNMLMTATADYRKANPEAVNSLKPGHLGGTKRSAATNAQLEEIRAVIEWALGGHSWAYIVECMDANKPLGSGGWQV